MNYIRPDSIVHKPTAPDQPWLQTLGGNRLDLVNPRPDQIDFRTIARVLSRVPRFGGHTEHGVLSVAQHCLEGAAAMRRDGQPLLAQAAFLLHDAHEAYMGDIATPVAEALVWITGEVPGSPTIVRRAIKALKERLDAAIYQAAGLPWPLDPATSRLVHTYDLRMCRTERDARLAPPPCAWDPAIENAEPIAGCDLYPWSPGTVEALYLAALRDQLPNVSGGPTTGVNPAILSDLGVDNSSLAE